MPIPRPDPSAPRLSPRGLGTASPPDPGGLQGLIARVRGGGVQSRASGASRAPGGFAASTGLFGDAGVPSPLGYASSGDTWNDWGPNHMGDVGPLGSSSAGGLGGGGTGPLGTASAPGGGAGQRWQSALRPPGGLASLIADRRPGQVGGGLPGRAPGGFAASTGLFGDAGVPMPGPLNFPGGSGAPIGAASAPGGRSSDGGAPGAVGTSGAPGAGTPLGRRGGGAQASAPGSWSPTGAGQPPAPPPGVTSDPPPRRPPGGFGRQSGGWQAGR